MKYLGWIVVAIAFCGAIWFAYPEREQKQEQDNQLITQIGEQYFSANYLLRNTVDELLEWNFSQPLTNADEDYFWHLKVDFYFITDLMFTGTVVHQEWRDRMDDIQGYLEQYRNKTSLTEEDVADLHQALKATQYISLDFDGYLDSYLDFYDAMHDEQHEMVEVVKKRLVTTY